MDTPNHFLLAVLVAADTTVDTLRERVRPILEAYLDVTCAWWSPGVYAAGAWSDYDPTADTANWATCTVCGGTGWRDDEIGRATRAARPDYTCNGCAGPGVALPHQETAIRPPGVVLSSPHGWNAHPDDMIPIRRILRPDWRFPAGAAPYALADPDGWQWLDRPGDGALDLLLRRALRAWQSSARDRWALSAINARAAGTYLYTLPGSGQTLSPTD